MPRRQPLTAVEVLEPAQSTLRELADAARQEHEAGCRAAGDALTHWMNSGDALTAARHRVEGPWHEWVETSVGVTSQTAASYMRLAHYRERVQNAEIKGVAEALKYLRGLPPVPTSTVRYSPRVQNQARELYAEEGNAEMVAARLGVHKSTVKRWIDPAYRKRHNADVDRRRRERKAERAEAERRARDNAVKKVGGSVAESYSMIRKTAQAIDRARVDATDREVRAALSAAYSKLTNAEDEIVRALGIQ
jgi:hypothetical protein